MSRRINDFVYKLTHWEYWPFAVVYLPVFIYWLWKSLKARSLFFFSASNPAIETGGMLGESKWSILKNFPEQFIPATVYFSPKTDIDLILLELEKKEISFPVIAKPDIGERGRLVKKIYNSEGLEKYSFALKTPFLVQEYVDLPVELGVFYYRYPDKSKGVVSSVVQKKFLKIEGDGVSTVKQLIEKKPRGRFQMERLFAQDPSLINKVLDPGEIIELEPIGNHNRGTMFIDGTDLIDEELTSVFDEVSRSIPGFYYGRFDLRCASVAELKKGRNFKILELNGAGSEPAHIYDPGFSLFKAWKVLLNHWNVLYEISIKNKARGASYLSFSEGVKKMMNWRKMQERESFSR